jgi:hypothetical protein
MAQAREAEDLVGAARHRPPGWGAPQRRGQELTNRAVETFVSKVDGVSVDAIVEAFSNIFDLVWSRARRAMGDVVLATTFDRTLARSRATDPVLEPVLLDLSGLFLEGLREGPESHAGALLRGLSSLLRETLATLDTMTGGVLGPPLRATLLDACGAPMTEPAGPIGDLRKADPSTALRGLHDRSPSSRPAAR